MKVMPIGLLLGAAAAVVVLACAAGLVLTRRAVGHAARLGGPRLKVLSGIEKGQSFAILSAPQTIGRLTSAPLHLSDPTGALRVSREHARVWLEDGAAWIEDAGSHHGTFVNGKRLAGRCRLANGARLRLGEVDLVAEGLTAAPSKATAKTAVAGVADGELGRETVLSDQARADAASDRLTCRQTGEDESRQTRLKPVATASATGTAADDEANRALQLAPAAGEDDVARQTRLKPAQAPGQDVIDQALRSTVLHRPSGADDEARQTKLKSG